MDFDDAKEVLAIHSGFSKTFDYSNETDFLGTLRPYQGIEDEYFHEIVEALFSIQDHFKQDVVDRELMLYLWEICSSTICLALREGSLLRRNKLISDEDLKKLNSWIHIIDSIGRYLLIKLSLADIIFSYVEYLQDNHYGENIENIIPFFLKALEAIDPKNDINGICYAVLELLAQIGSKAKFCLPSLRKLSKKKSLKKISKQINYAILEIEKS
ncbi:hypothetical protein [Candidatus Uabimicrobium sp. HlEnr_7]|uniref:hypothetical protein n=1 Tax=Candidatus Uabimicrobium helgolandensis TaxID=3095367 RepID=UPI003558CCEF